MKDSLKEEMKKDADDVDVSTEGLRDLALLANRAMSLLGQGANKLFVENRPPNDAVRSLTKWVEDNGAPPLVGHALMRYDALTLAAALCTKLSVHRKLVEDTIPSVMDELGLRNLELDNGYRVAVVDEVAAAIRVGRENDAVEWLDAHGLGDVVKDTVTVLYGRGERTNAAELMRLCSENGWTATERLTVHPQTLKAMVKEQLSRGVQFPEESFSVEPYRRTTIKLKR